MTLAAAMPIIISALAVLISLFMALRSKKGDDSKHGEDIGRLKERMESWGARPEPDMAKWMGMVDARMENLNYELRRAADKMETVSKRDAEVEMLRKEVDELRRAIRTIEERTLKIERLLAELNALSREGKHYEN